MLRPPFQLRPTVFAAKFHCAVIGQRAEMARMLRATGDALHSSIKDSGKELPQEPSAS